jgi:hypothetical protein
LRAKRRRTPTKDRTSCGRSADNRSKPWITDAIHQKPGGRVSLLPRRSNPLMVRWPNGSRLKANNGRLIMYCPVQQDFLWPLGQPPLAATRRRTGTESGCSRQEDVLCLRRKTRFALVHPTIAFLRAMCRRLRNRLRRRGRTPRQRDPVPPAAVARSQRANAYADVGCSKRPPRRVALVPGAPVTA